MMHFARVFPPYGMPAFEVYSYGIRTRVVMRNDFIEDYGNIESLTSIGPFYTVRWRIEENLTQNTIITINTNEDSAVLFDLAAARFHFENILSVPPMPPELHGSDIASEWAWEDIKRAHSLGLIPFQMIL